VIDPGLFPLNSWQHVAFVADGAMLRLYRNGVEIGTPISYDGTLRTTLPCLSIGVKQNDSCTGPSPSASGFWDGLIDELSIYNRALSPAEIQSIFNAGSAGKCKAAPATFTISGRVLEGDNGLAGVTITLSGTQSATTTTDANGFYSFANLAAGGNYVVTPTRSGFAFSPPNQSFNNLQANQAADFSATNAADLSLTLTDSPDPVTVGSNLTYTATVSNNGPNPATGVVLTDTLPAGVNFVSASSRCSQSGGTVACNLGDLASGATVPVTIVVMPTQTGTITNTASVTSSVNDSNTANNTATTSTTVNAPSANLSISLSDSPDPVQVGSNLTYTVNVFNNGPSTATGVTVTDSLPSSVTFVSVTSTQGTCTGTSAITCNLGTLNSGTSARVIIVVTPTRAGTITNTASVTATEPDPNQANNTASQNTTVLAPRRPLEPVARETGRVSLSIDGLGTSQGSGIIQVEKPAGATVRKAFLAAAAVFGFTDLPNGNVRIDGVGVNWDLVTSTSISSVNTFADVTSIVKPKIDAAAAGRVDFAITEINSSRIDGETLAVIFDDPNQTTTNTVILLFGAQDVRGDSFAIGLAEPINKSDPNLVLNMSLGISFGFQSTNSGGQHSTVDVNGQRLSSSAGGQDDGDSSGSGLLTVGGLDDSNANPVDPLANSGPAGFARTMSCTTSDHSSRMAR
jgi:uncharacterized repeat protein (TIGR01451 family)